MDACIDSSGHPGARFSTTKEGGREGMEGGKERLDIPGHRHRSHEKRLVDANHGC